MHKIKIRYKFETIIGELLVIFCTIFHAFGQNGADISRLLSNNVRYTGSTNFILNMEEMKMERIAATETKRWYFPVQNDDKNFAVVVSSNLTNIRWLLYFRDRRDVGPLTSPGGSILFNSTQSKSIGYSSDDSRLGLYIVEITAAEDAFISLFLTKQDYEATTNLINIVDKVEKPRQIKVKLDVKNSSCMVEWPEIMQNYYEPALNLFMVVSSEKYFKFLPHVTDGAISSNRGDSKKFFLLKNVTSSQSTIIGDLRLEQIYYITLLAANEAKFSVTYGRTSFKFQKTKPLGLKDGKLVKKSLKQNGGRLSYKYKVSRQRLNVSNPLIWYVSRCSGKIWVKIKLKKKLIEERLVSKYEIFVLENLQPDSRYVMKITDASRDQNLDFDDVEVLASMRPQMQPLLKAPRSLRVDFSSNRTTSVVNWRPVYSNEPIQYCIYTREIHLTELTKSSIENMKIANQCSFNESKAFYNFNYQYCNILYESSGRRLRSKLKNHNRDLAVQITAEKLRSKITIVYDLLLIPNGNPT